jgi:hypothetical protein
MILKMKKCLPSLLKILRSAYTQYTQNNCTSLNTGPIKTFFLTKPQYLSITNYKKVLYSKSAPKKFSRLCTFKSSFTLVLITYSIHAGIYKVTVRTADIVSFARAFVQKCCKNLQKLYFQPQTFLFAFVTIQAFFYFFNGKTELLTRV